MAQRYEVIGTRRVHGKVKGETFFASIPPEIEALLLDVHIKRIDSSLPRVTRRPNVVPSFIPTQSQEEKPNHG